MIPAYYLVSNGIQEIRENGFGRENIPAMMAAVVVISVPLDHFVSDIPEKSHGRRFERRSQRMKHLFRKAWALCPCRRIHSLPVYGLPRHCTSSTTFALPDTFDTSKSYEVTFWAKNDTNKTSDRYLQKGHCRFSSAVSQHYGESETLYRLWENLQRRHHQPGYRNHTGCVHHLPGPHCHLLNL